ncbi:MAG: HPr family phosphocarrier protein [Acutalibacteraceae bacterium]|nr:HPr family phosphocarrier protein [Acutalibacteraceae bacterium]
MITKKVLLNNIESVNCFVKKMGDKDFEVDLISGKYLVNAKSMMGVLSLDLTQPVTVNAYTDDENFISEIQQYIFEE